MIRKFAAAAVAILIGCQPAAAASSNRAKASVQAVDASDLYESGMSPFGLLARMAATGRLEGVLQRARLTGSSRVGLKVEPPLEDEDDGSDPIVGGQAEMSIAVDGTGNNVVVGFNDTRGFALTPVSLSGFAYSSDGGVTFTDGGTLPSAQQGTSAGTALPQVFGDPDVKFVPGGGNCQFIYASIEVVGLGGTGSAPTITYTGTAQTMSIHRSIDCGHTWSGPFEVFSATNPTGVLSGGSARDAADKEFIDIDPDTGRVLLSWSNFTVASVIPGGIQIRTTYSDNVMSGSPPAWSTSAVLNAGTTRSDTGSMPRFAGQGSPNAYVVWNSRNFAGNLTPYGGDGYQNTMVARSTDNGVTWSAGIKLHTAGAGTGGDFFPMDQIPGDDRIHSFPTMAVDTTAGAFSGSVYVVYSANDSKDGGDIFFSRSTNGGTSFSTPVTLNARPGSDRSQWFPYVSVNNAGRVYVIWYDQQNATSGDLTETMMTFSDDGGSTWKRPSPLTDRPFHAGYGNDTGQPNIGDYIASTTSGANLVATWAGTPPSVSFTDGQPTSASMTVPDFYVTKTTTAKAAIKLGDVVSVETSGYSNGNSYFDPGERIDITLPLSNYVSNLTVGAAAYASVSATLSTSTVGVSIVTATQGYGTINANASVSNASPFVIQLLPTLVAGTKVNLVLTVTAAGGESTTLPFTLNTGTPVVATTLINEDFNSAVAPALPVGWSSSHQGASTTVPWLTNSTFCNTTSNALFHANDAVGSPTRFERANSPIVVVPATAAPQIVTLDFDICYETEDDPDFNVLAYDGFTLRITDSTGGRTARSVLAEAFAEQIRNGNSAPYTNHYPKHLPRNSSTSYFQDMSVWAGRSGGFKHVHMELPGMQGSSVQLRWEYTQDSAGICTDAHAGAGYSGVCGVMVDNIVMNAVTFNPALVDLTFSGATASPPTLAAGDSVTYTFTVASSNSGFNAATTTFSDPLPANVNFTSLNAPAGWVCTMPSVGSTGTVSCTHPSMPFNSTATFTIVAAVASGAVDGALSNTAAVSTASGETSTANNSGVASLTVASRVTYSGNGSTGGSVPVDATLYAPGNTVTVKANTGSLVRTGYTFAGWNTAANGSGTTYAATGSATFTMGNTSVTLFALWTINNYTVTFNSNGGTAVGSQSVQYNSTATAPANPTRTGYTFGGWFSDAGLTTAFSFATPITADITLFAKWTINTYTVTFNSNGGTAVTSQSIQYNALATAPAAPTRTGYTFGGWFSDAGLTAAFSFATPITADITLFAKWTINTYTVTFNSNGGTAVTSQSIQYNALATAPAAPTRIGFTFGGWFSDAGLTTVFSFATPITADITLFAKWTINTYTVTFNSNGGTAVASQSDQYNTTATAPATPTRTGFSFGGWFSDAGLTTAFSFATPITADITLYARWSLVPTYTVTYNGNGSSGGSVPVDAATYASGATVTVLGNTGALVRVGFLFAGWNTAADGTGTSYAAGATFTMASANVNLYAQWTCVVLDVDGNHSYDGLTDGLLVIRYLFGLTDNPLIANAIGSGATRTDANQIKSYLDQVSALLDIDGNGHPDALTDGLAILRYLFGLRGAAVINGAIGAGATRTTVVDIEAYLQSLMQ